MTATAVSNYQVNLSWNSDPGAANYTLERSLDDSSWKVLGSTSGTTYSDTGLQAGTTYYFRIQASNVIGTSPYSAPVSAGTSAVAPGTPTGLAAIVFANNQIFLSWNSEPNALNYYLERSLDGKNWQLIAGVGNQTSYNDTGLQSGTTYYYSVWASNTIGSSNVSAPISAITYPATPTGLTAATGSTAVWITNASINLHWNSDPGATSYMLMRSSVNDPNPYDSNWQYVATVSGTSYTDTRLNSATTYYYSIMAMNAAGYQQSSFCAPVSGVSSMTSDEHFVHALYQDFLKRPGSKTEWDGWAVQMSNMEVQLWVKGYTEAQAQTQAQFAVANSIVHSGEYYTNLVNGMYSHYLGRPADALGFNVWYSELASGQTFEQVLSQFLASPEFYNRSGGNNTTFVQTLYVDLLNRPADAGGLGYWVNVLNSGASRQSVVSVFVTGSEFRTYAVEALYGKGESYWFVPNMLNRYADSAGLSSWVNYWNNSGTNLLTMDANFAATSEFYADAQNM